MFFFISLKFGTRVRKLKKVASWVLALVSSLALCLSVFVVMVVLVFSLPVRPCAYLCLSGVLLSGVVELEGFDDVLLPCTFLSCLRSYSLSIVCAG